MSNRKNPLVSADSHDVSRAKNLVDAIINNRIFIVVNSKNCDCTFLEKDERYISQFTYVLKKWGYVGKSRSNDYLAHLNKYAPNQNISSTLSWFMNDAREAGLTDNDRDWSGASFDTIWV